MAVAIDAGQRLGQHVAEGAAGALFDLGHLGHGQTGRVDPVKTGSNEHVADDDVGVGRDEAQFEHAALAAAMGHATQTVAQHLHGNGLLLVGQQGHFGSEREYARDLPHHTGIVDHGQAKLHVVVAAAVKYDLAGGRIARVVQDLAHQGGQGDGGARAHQLAQLEVFSRLQLGHLHGLRVGDLGGAQLAHFGLQFRLRGEVAACALQRVARHQGGHLQRVEDGAGDLADGGESLEARIGNQQGDRKESENRHLHPRGRTLFKQRRWTVLHVFQ